MREGPDFACLADLEELNSLLSLLFSQEKEFTPNPELQALALERLLKGSDRAQVFVYRHQDKAVGMLSLQRVVSTACGGEVGLLEDFVVQPPYRGRGWGRRLLQFALNFARQQNLQRITLLTDADNALAQKLYQKEGFTPSSMLVLRWAPSV